MYSLLNHYGIAHNSLFQNQKVNQTYDNSQLVELIVDEVVVATETGIHIIRISSETVEFDESTSLLNLVFTSSI